MPSETTPPMSDAEWLREIAKYAESIELDGCCGGGAIADEAIARLRAIATELEDLRNTLRLAKAEILWWVEEHGCCAGHEFEAVQAIDLALSEQRPCTPDRVRITIHPA